MKQWKIAFFIAAGLCALLIITAVILIVMMFADVDARKDYQPSNREGDAVFTVSTTKQRLNHLIQSQLERLKFNREKIDFTARIDEHVNVTGFVTVFDSQLSFQMTLEPSVQENGDILLKQEAFYIGQLPVPSKQVLSFIDAGAKLPKWVIIEPSDESIYIALNEIEVSDDMIVKANTIDLANDQIVFDIIYVDKE